MCTRMDVQNPYQKNCEYFIIPQYRQLGAGPVNCSVETMNAMLFQPITPVNKHFFKMLDDIKAMAKYIFQTKNELTLAAQVSGNGGNEMMITNLADPGETIIVASAGVWGDKVADMGQRYGLNVIYLSKKAGEVYGFQELEEAIIKYKPVALFVTQGESSGGTLQPLEGLGKICHKYDCLLAVDAVVSVGVVPLFVDRWEIDAVTGATQKGIGAPAGICLISFSDRAYKKILSKKQPTPYIYDTKELGKVWNCYGAPRSYHYTYGSPQVAALRQALTEICEEGLENVWNRHLQASQLFLNRIEKIGLEIFVTKSENRFCGVNIVRLPKDLTHLEILDRLMDKHMIEISFGIGPSQDKEEMRNLRIGFLAKNAQPEYVNNLVEALKESIEYCTSHKSQENNSLKLVF